MRDVSLSRLIRSQDGFIPAPKGLVGGFTLIEVAIAMAIMAVLFSIGLFFGPNFYRGQILLAERDNMISILMRARSKAANNIHGVDHGVYVATEEYILFEGSSYATRNVVYDERYPRAGGVEVSGVSELVFHSLEATASPPGTITVGGQAISVGTEGELNW